MAIYLLNELKFFQSNETKKEIKNTHTFYFALYYYFWKSQKIEFVLQCSKNQKKRQPCLSINRHYIQGTFTVKV